MHSPAYLQGGCQFVDSRQVRRQIGQVGPAVTSHRAAKETGAICPQWKETKHSGSCLLLGQPNSDVHAPSSPTASSGNWHSTGHLGRGKLALVQAEPRDGAHQGSKPGPHLHLLRLLPYRSTVARIHLVSFGARFVQTSASSAQLAFGARSDKPWGQQLTPSCPCRIWTGS